MMDDNNSLKKLFQLESEYSSYKVTKKEAIAKAKPLISEYNKKVKDLAQKYNMRPKLISLKKFSFGR